MSTDDNDINLLTQLDTLITAAADTMESFDPKDAEYEAAMKAYTHLIDQRKKLIPEPAPAVIEVVEPKSNRWAWTQHLIAPGFALIGTLAILGAEIFGHSAKQAWDEKKSIKSGR